ncbi:hypothetical protein DF19_08360 [Streptomyces olindensis]|nr:hypothetical protein DF19_08360 [Streptomyces olindensis]
MHWAATQATVSTEISKSIQVEIHAGLGEGSPPPMVIDWNRMDVQGAGQRNEEGVEFIGSLLVE